MEKWSFGQIELFHALGKICEKIGREGATELVRGNNGELSGINVADTGTFLGELERLRVKAERVDELQRENERLKANLERALSGRFGNDSTRVENENHDAGPVNELQKKETKKLKADSNMASGRTLGGDSMKEIMTAGNESDGSKSGSFGGHVEQKQLDKLYNGQDMSREHLMQKHTTLVEGHKQLLLAREQLEKKLRSSQKSTKEWVEYANALEKRIDKLENKLTKYGIHLKRHSGTPKSAVENPVSDGDVASTPTARSGRQQRPSENHDTVLHVNQTGFGDRLDYSPSKRPFPAAFSGQNIKEQVPQQDIIVKSSSSDHDSVTTEEFVGGSPDMSPRKQVDIPRPFIKEEPLSDTPVVISCRSVRKRKTRDGEGLTETAANIKVKVESITSSPVGLAGLQNLIAQESLDLDDIGEKMNTPKKRRNAYQLLGSENISSASKTPQVEAVAIREEGRDTQPKRYDAILQPASPNKQILPRTSWKEKAPKRRRLEDQLMAAVILGEDGENYVTRRRPTEAEIKGGNPRDLLPSLLNLDRRLNGLLEEPSPKKEALTPVRPLRFSATVARPQMRAVVTNSHTGLTPSNQRQSRTFVTPNTAIFSRDAPKTDHKASTAKKRSFGTPKGVQAFDGDSPDQGPLRARSLCRLDLKHFRINPNFNQGSDYAFADVVRGRELRKCLPGCTKPECCGDKFRKLVELSMDHEKQTASQEADNENLLMDYLGDNRGRLRNMSAKEKEELLILAKSRELANKASKHRHAYERQRSPPGFWRSDFPSTQELIIDRQEAANRERELVQHRYEEAMRPGGRWLFRDE